MEDEQLLKILKIVRNSALAILFILCILLICFSLFSGSEALGGGLTGVLKNSPNSLPWILLLIILIIARKRNVLGGFLILIFGVGITYFFNFMGQNFFLTTFIVCLLIILLGILVLFTGATIAKNNNSDS